LLWSLNVNCSNVCTSVESCYEVAMVLIVSFDYSLEMNRLF